LWLTPVLLFLHRIALAIQSILWLLWILELIFFYFCEEYHWNFNVMNLWITLNNFS
jgi:hypothetical protein